MIHTHALLCLVLSLTGSPSQDTIRLRGKTPAPPPPAATAPAGPSRASQDSIENVRAEVHEQNEDRIATATERLTDVTRMLALGTIMLAIVTGLVWFATRQLALEAGRDSEKQVSEMKEQLKELKKTTELTRSMSTRQLRAYVHVIDAQYHPATGADAHRLAQPAHAIIRIQNFGLTPARDVRAVAVYHYGPNSTDRAIVAAHLATSPPFILAPGESIVRSAPSSEVPRYEPKGYIDVETMVYGEVTYLDAFNQQHFTRFSYMGSLEGPMVPTCYGNETDVDPDPLETPKPEELAPVVNPRRTLVGTLAERLRVKVRGGADRPLV